MSNKDKYLNSMQKICVDRAKHIGLEIGPDTKTTDDGYVFFTGREIRRKLRKYSHLQIKDD